MKSSYLITAGILLVLLAAPVAAQDLVPNDTTKTMILYFHIKGSTVTYLDGRVIYGHPPNTLDIPDTFTATMLGNGDRQLGKFGISDPRITYSDEGHLFADDINFSVKIPATMDLAGVEISNTKTGALLARADTAAVMKGFCTAHPKDPDCSRIPLPVLLAGAGLIILCALGAGWYLLKRRKA